MTTAAVALLPPREGWSDAKRRLLEAAIVLFGEHGVHGVSVRDLMGALGQQPGALYGHVQSKQHLLLELVLLGHEEHQRRIQQALLEAGSDPVEQVRAVTRAHVLAHLTYPALSRVTTREARALEPEHRAELSRRVAGSEQVLLDVIERGLRLGAFHVDAPDLAVAAIGAMGVRAAERWSDDGSHSPEDVADTYAEYAVKLLS